MNGLINLLFRLLQRRCNKVTTNGLAAIGNYELGCIYRLICKFLATFVLIIILLPLLIILMFSMSVTLC